MSRRPTVATAFGFGLRWAPGMEIILEGAVGVALVGVGIWSLRTARNLHLHHPGEHRAHGHAVASPGRMAGWAGAGGIAVGLLWLGGVLLAG